MAGGQLVLLGKPFGGVVGVPGSVLGYLALAAAVLGTATALLCVWRIRLSLQIASASGVLAGLAILVAGVADTVAVFTIAILLAGAAVGPLLVAGRALAADLGGASSVFGNAAAVTGVAAAAWLGGRYYEEPGTGLIIAGVLTAFFGASAGLLGRRGVDSNSPAQPMRFGIPARTILAGYAETGLAVGGTVLPALHLLLFRWNEFGVEQLTWLLFAAAPAAVAVVFPGRKQAGVPVLVVLAAGGALLVATAPGPVTLTIGLAVIMLAAARAVAALDEAIWASVPHRDKGVTAAVGAIVVAITGIAGLGLVDLLGRLVGTGSALSVLAGCVLIAVLLFSRPGRQPRPDAGGSSIERGRQ
ncbi:hypothetical protein ACFWF7_36070 [Nocardia sp. NPDC060256]|uniref:hypothetical protein n=1 Tax=unclassified Nocardia TaxID=2637762 RepID=UPI00366799AA